MGSFCVLGVLRDSVRDTGFPSTPIALKGEGLEPSALHPLAMALGVLYGRHG